MEFVDEYILRGAFVERMSEQEFLRFCRDNPALRIERTADGTLVLMSPTGSRSGRINSEIIYQLTAWTKAGGGGHVFDSSTAFRLPDGSTRSPDAAWVADARWRALSRAEQEGFAPLCPDVVIELRSPSDRRETLERKMRVWMDNGCRLAFLVDPVEEEAVAHHADGRREHAPDFEGTLGGEPVLPGFALDLTELL